MWARIIKSLLKELEITQKELARLLGTSHNTPHSGSCVISNWISVPGQTPQRWYWRRIKELWLLVRLKRSERRR
jgi:hypothetical protein